MAKYIKPTELRTKLAKHVRMLINREALAIKDPGQRSQFLAKMLGAETLMGAAHPEPGGHEPVQAGVPAHMEPGAHEQSVAAPPAAVPSGEAEPVGGGVGIPGAQLLPDEGDSGTPLPNEENCPLCNQPDEPGKCTCLNDQILGKNEEGQESGSFSGPASQGVTPPGSAPMALSELCKTCGGKHAPMDKCMVAKKETNPGANGEPTKQQPLKPVAGAKLPEKTEEIEHNEGAGSVSEPKKGKSLGKDEVPAAKPPKPAAVSTAPKTSTSPAAPKAPKIGVPMGKDEDLGEGAMGMEKQAQPLSKPPVSEAQRRAMGAAAGGNSTLGIPKTVGKEFIDADKGGKLPETKKSETMAKAAPPPAAKAQMKQHMAVDASKAAAKPAAAPAPGAGAAAANPLGQDRAGEFHAAMQGQFQPPAAAPKPAAPGAAPVQMKGPAPMPKYAPPVAAAPAAPKMAGLERVTTTPSPFARLFGGIKKA